ncbi:4-hydroxy-tetrahydrodipicolinate synthase [soil metagenome]
MSFAGTHTALITPFANGTLDEDAFRALIDRQFEAGIKGVVPVGTTGESPTLTHQEHERVIKLAIAITERRGHVIAGTGSNATDEAITLTQAAEKAGATASLQVCPYYNKPSQEGLYQHFKAIAKSTGLPIILYSIPGRCGVEIGVETVARLANDLPNIVAVKEAGGSVERVSQLADACPDGFEILSGDDSLTLPFMSVGACGLISVASNLIPAEMAQLVECALAGRWEGAHVLHQKFYPLFAALLKLDTNPVPIKTAMELAGLAPGSLRLPLVPMADASRAQLKSQLEALSLISP